MCASSSGNVSDLPLNQLINKDCLIYGAGNWFEWMLFIISPFIIEEFSCFTPSRYTLERKDVNKIPITFCTISPSCIGWFANGRKPNSEVITQITHNTSKQLKMQLVSVLLFIGWRTGARFFQPIITHSTCNRVIIFDSHLKTVL